MSNSPKLTGAISPVPMAVASRDWPATVRRSLDGESLGSLTATDAVSLPGVAISPNHSTFCPASAHLLMPLREEMRAPSEFGSE